MSDENDLPDTIPIFLNGNLYWMPKAYLKDLGERIEKLEKEVKRLGNLSSAQFQTNINLTRKLLELEKNQKILQQLIPLDWQQKENTKEIAELGNKIKGLEGFAHSHIDDKQRRRMIEDIAELKEKQEYDDDELRVEVARHIEIIGNHEANIAELKEHLEITDEFIPDMQLTLDNQERQHGEIAELKSALFKHLQYEGDPLWEELGGEKESLIEREEVACEQDTLPLRDDSKPTEPNACDEYGNPIRTFISGSVEPIDKKDSEGEKEVGDIERCNHSRKTGSQPLPNSKPTEPNYDEWTKIMKEKYKDSEGEKE
jgi:hypothetical protein